MEAVGFGVFFGWLSAERPPLPEEENTALEEKKGSLKFYKVYSRFLPFFIDYFLIRK